MVVNGQKKSQLSLEFLPTAAARPRPAQMCAPSQKSNPAQLRMEAEAFLLKEMNSAFNSLLSLLEKARPEGGKYFRSELCRIFCARIEGEKAILEKFPSKAEMEKAHSLLRSLEYLSGYFQRNMRGDDWKWKAVSEEEQNITYARERFSAMGFLSGLHSLLEKREYRDFILVLSLYEKNAIESARSPMRYGKPKPSGYEVLVCSDLQCAVSKKVELLAELKENSQ